ncbi:hypothetical protein [Sphingobacterium sp. LRF_L2]|uniref:hypothetical protein n=1 Tax=Sphingobacterium sp. LRF_L2 TaxID=3369421 RepID=UPI003F610EC8
MSAFFVPLPCKKTKYKNGRRMVSEITIGQTLIVFFGIFFGFGTGFLRFQLMQRSKNYREILLCTTVFIMTWHFVVYFLIVSKLILHFPYLYNKGIPMYYLIAPSLYFYVKYSLYPTSQLPKLAYLHLLPALFGLIDTIPYLFASADEQQHLLKIVVNNMSEGFSHSLGFIDQKWHYQLRYLLAFIYFGAQCHLIFQFENDTLEQKKHVRRIYFLTLIYGIHLIFQGSIVVNVLLNKIHSSFILSDAERLTNVGLAFIIFGAGLFFQTLLLFSKIKGTRSCMGRTESSCAKQE